MPEPPLDSIGQLVEGGPRRVWLKAFWGFDPASDGYVGFTRPADRARLIAEWQPGDLILIYGADARETEAENRRQALGFLEIDPVAVTDIERSSAEGIRRKRDMNCADRWTNAVPVRRAWQVMRRIEVKHLAPDTYTPSYARLIASRGEVLAPHESAAALQLPVIPVNVFGEPEIVGAVATEMRMADAFQPSKGFTPSHGERAANYEDGDTFLYMLSYVGCVPTLLGRERFAVGSRVAVKIGISNDPRGRCDQINGGFPPAAACRWKVELKSKAFSKAAEAKAAEDGLKAVLAQRAESLGGEFFLGDPNVLHSAFYEAASAVAFKLTAVSQRR